MRSLASGQSAQQASELSLSTQWGGMPAGQSGILKGSLYMKRSGLIRILTGGMRRGAGLLGLALACAGAAHAQVTGPLPTSPAQPIPYQSPLFHAGGAPPPNLFPAITLPAQNPLFVQLQGTPTDLNSAGIPTQIPSFLLGNYNPTQPPTTAGTYFPDHFADGDIFAWQAPFDYIPASASAVTVDDTDTVNFVPAGFVQINTGNVAGTATGGEYYRLPPNTNGSASWTLTAITAGNYSVYFHIPDNTDDGTGFVEQRSTAVNYTIIVTGAAGQTATATASQTEANSLQYLAGPFQLSAGDTITVTLQRDASHNQANSADYLIADSMTIQPAIGDVRSTPTAINASAYPLDFKNVKYWGITAGGIPATTGGPATLLAANAPPDVTTTGLPILRTGDSTTSNGDHLVRQLVYFGRSEPALSSRTIVDNNSFSGPSTTVSDPTATNGSYSAAAPTNGGVPSATASWTLTAPSGGKYFLSAHLPQTLTTQRRISDATYTVTYGAITKVVKISQVTGIGAASSVVLPTGPIALAKGQTVTVVLGNNTALTPLTGSPPYAVVADSVSITTSPGTGAIYCVDGFTGEVVWRFETPASSRGPSAPIFSSPAIAKINVLTGTNPATYANKLVVIVGDDNGFVYCLDAIGYGNGTSNSAAIDPTSGQPIYGLQPVYGTTPTDQVTAAAVPTDPHVGTTPLYWMYRPDAGRPKNITTGLVKATPDPLSDLPIPGAFGTASPTIFVDPSVATAAPTASNATVFVGNSNGVLYALDALGVPIDGTSKATFAATGDKFNVSLDLRSDPTVFPAAATDPILPTCQPKWWFTLRGPSPNSGSGATSADIESAPAVSVSVAAGVYTPTVYVGSAHEQESTSNVGRLYALNGLLGPSGNNGQNYPTTAVGVPGSPNYNVGQRPQISKADTADWAFPDAYGTDTYTTGKSTSGKPRPALGNITGSPVVFTDPNETDVTRQTRIYFAANTGLEIPAGSTATTPLPRPDDTQTGRVWAVNLDGSVGTTTNSGAGTNVWAYPEANNPNDATKDTVAEPFAPIGAFVHATPAIGFVQFPTTITNGDGSTYAPVDVFGSIKGRSVPMLYVGTRGVNDTALYAVDIDGDMSGATDQRTVYRQISPDGAIFQSSPVLITNASSAGGNGGAVYITGGNTLYDFGATPISNPIGGQAFPLIRENRAFVGFGPISSPTIAAADVTDITTASFLTTNSYATNATDWVYVGDSSTGFCRGITPNDTTYGGIPPDLGTGILPPNPEPPNPIDLNALLHTYLVSDANQSSQKYTDMLPIGPTAPLPVYEWGQNVYIRVANVVPPNPTSDPNLFVGDPTSAAAATPAAPVTVYSDGGPIEFDLADTSPEDPTTIRFTDHARIPAVIVPALPADGFIARTDTVATPASPNLVAANKKQYIGAYTYAIGDGTARKNTPGGRRRLINVQQIVHTFSFDGTSYKPLNKTVILSATATNGNEVSVKPADGSYKFVTVQPVDQPTFGILNPLGVRGGGVPLSLSAATPSNAVEIGDPLGPFRGAASPPPPSGTGGDYDCLQALADGNTIFTLGAPPSTSLPGNPTKLATGANDPAGNSLPTAPKTVVTSTGLINHNQGGDNTDPSQNALPTGVYPAGLSRTNFGSPDSPYALDIFDRSALNLVAKTLKVKAGPAGTTGREGLYWNDNSNNLTGHDAVVNFLPWEAPPVSYKVGANTSPDYPDISTNRVSYTLQAGNSGGGSSGSLASDGAVPIPVTGDPKDVLHRTVYATPLQVHIDMPQFQPANQQLYSKTRASSTGYSTNGETTPQGIVSAADVVFPMGYVTTKRIYVPNQNGRYDSGCAYRDVSVYSGVPPSISTSIADGTLDIGQVPSSFGIQTSSYAPLGGPLPFTPYNPAYQSYYLPVTVHNDGNVNLLNVHFDQKVSTGPGSLLSLLFPSDTVDPLSAIPAFDSALTTGPRNGTFGAEREQPFLLRSSLDTDLGIAYGRNPGIAGSAFSAFYPSTTFHKARVGSVAPALTVPDFPSNNVPGTPFGLAGNNNAPLVIANGLAVNNTGQPATAPPYVSLAIPFGTPFGTYAQTLRLFEGMDIAGYTTYNGSNQSYNPLYPPQYGTAVGGIGTPSSIPTDIYQYGAQPISDPGVVVKASVLEDRLTDGLTFGALPQIDPGPAGTGTGGAPRSTPDFAPAAFQAFGGNLSVYWTSGRAGVGNYGIYGANVGYSAPAYLPAYLPASNGQSWFTSINPTLAAGTNSGLTIAQDVPVLSGGTFASDPNTAYAFAVNVNTPPYQNSLYCYPVTPNTGALGAAQLITSDPAQVKYGVRGLYCSEAGFTNNLWAFWTASTRGRTAVYYNSRPAGTGNWPIKSAPLTVPAGLTAVSDACPTLIYAPITTAAGVTTLQPTIEVTFSGTAANGNADLYVCRYIPDGTNPSQLDLQSFQLVTESLKPIAGWLQARDVAWSRTGGLNVLVGGVPVLYNATNKPLFKSATFDRASGLLVFSGVSLTPATAGTFTNTLYVDASTGRLRFVTAPAAAVTATFNPQARRITDDARADTGVVTFLDPTFKNNEASGLGRVQTDRRWYFWRKTGTADDTASATLYEKAQRLTAFLPKPVDVTKTITVTVGGAAYSGAYDLVNLPTSARLYFPISSGGYNEGQSVTVTYTPAGGTTTFTTPLDTIQWQDEQRANDNSVPPTDAISGLATVVDTRVTMDKHVNENNVAAFLDVNAYNDLSAVPPATTPDYPHKIWLFWNSTRNGTADLYYETINPRFTAEP